MNCLSETHLVVFPVPGLSVVVVLQVAQLSRRFRSGMEMMTSLGLPMRSLPGQTSLTALRQTIGLSAPSHVVRRPPRTANRIPVGGILAYAARLRGSGRQLETAPARQSDRQVCFCCVDSFVNGLRNRPDNLIQHLIDSQTEGNSDHMGVVCWSDGFDI